MYKWTYNDMVCLIVQMKLYAVNELDLPVMGVYSRTRKISVLLILCTYLPRQRSSLSCSHQLHQLANPTYLISEAIYTHYEIQSKQERGIM